MLHFRTVSKLRLIIITTIAVAVLILLVFFVVGFFNEKPAGIRIDTTPSATVYINDEDVGRTPLKTTKKAGEIVVRLVPDAVDKPLVPYETKITLVSGIETIVQWQFSDSEDKSSGAVASFEKTAENEVSLAVVSNPEASQVIIDGKVEGFTPLKTSTITVGEHALSVVAPGYEEKTIGIRTHEGYKLTVAFKLAVKETSEEIVVEEIKEDEPKEEKPRISIKETPTGFLRVRSEPSTLAEEVGKVEPGDEYEIVEKDEKTGWYKIEYKEGSFGWVSNSYVEVIESESESQNEE